MKKYLAISAILGLVILVGYPTVKANPSFFIRQQTNSATSTLAYLSAGTGTTTLTFDLGASGAQGADSAILNTQFTASSTSSVLKVYLEYSQDGVDWYQNNLGTQATTSAQQDIGTSEQYFLWKFASSTPGYGAITNTNITNKVITIPTPERYVRATYTMPAGSSAGAIWASFVAKRQAN